MKTEERLKYLSEVRDKIEELGNNMTHSSEVINLISEIESKEKQYNDDGTINTFYNSIQRMKKKELASYYRSVTPKRGAKFSEYKSLVIEFSFILDRQIQLIEEAIDRALGDDEI